MRDELKIVIQKKISFQNMKWDSAVIYFQKIKKKSEKSEKRKAFPFGF